MDHSLMMVFVAQISQIEEVYGKDSFLYVVLAVLLIGLVLLIVYNRFSVYQDRKIQKLRANQNARLALILETGKLRIWVYHPVTRHYAYLSKDGTYDEDYNAVEYAKRFNREQFEMLRQAVFDISDGKRESAVVSITNNTTDPEEKRYYEMNISVGSRDAKGRVKSLLGIQHDVTDKVKKQEHINQLLMRNHTVFSSSLLDMIYCDKEGTLIDINEKACQTFGIVNREKYLSSQSTIFNNPLFQPMGKSMRENIHTSTLLDINKYELPGKEAVAGMSDGKIYYESTINPMYDPNGELEGFYMCGMDITEMVEAFHRMKESSRKVHRAMAEVQTYVTNINYALRISGVRFVSYYPEIYTANVSSNIGSTQIRLSQSRCIRLATIPYRKTVSRMLNRMDHLTRNNILETIETNLYDKQGRSIWLMLNMVPIIDKNNKVERYFGICRDTTDMVETEERLAVETKKAQETELLKQSFLTNMSYEIRTPLNNVVGFAELFEAPHEEADEAFFVNQIKDSSNTLLFLINDILFLSRLDANMIEIAPSYIDFPLLFESHCQLGWSNRSSEIKTIIDNPYEHLVVNIDETNLGKVIEKLCSLATTFTHQGSITARCEYRRRELTITIQDTGVGIDAQTLPHVFERFVRNQKEELCGTGLDLPIVQSLVHQMNGTIDIESGQGKGTTVWVSIPCQAKTIEKRKL